MHRSSRLATQGQAAMRLVIVLLVGAGPVMFAAETLENTSAVEMERIQTNGVPKPSQVIARLPAGVLAFALIGTASYAGGELAFFDGNREEFKTSVHRAEKIGDWTVVMIAFDHVRLAMGTNEFDLPMEKQLRREDSGEWQVKPLTARFTPTEDSRSGQSRPVSEAGSDQRRSFTQFSDARSGVRPARTNRRTGNRANRAGD